MPSEDSGKPRYTLVIIFVFLGLPILLCGGTLSWWFGRRAIAANQLEEKRSEIVARGLPIDNQSLDDFRYQRMSHDNSVRWMRVLDQLDSQEFSASCEGIPIVGVPADDQPYVPGQPYKYDDDVRVFLTNWAELLAEMHQIAEGSGPIWTEIHFDSFNTLLPRVQTSRTAARILTLEMEDAIRRENRDQVFHSLMAMIGVSRTLEEEPLIISQLVHIALGAAAVRKLKQAIELNLLHEDQLQNLLEQLRAFDDFGSGYRLAIAGERAMSQPIFDDPNRLGQSPGVNAFGARPIDALAALDMLGRAESIPSDDLGIFFAECQKLEADLQQEMNNAGLLKQFDTVLTGMTIPAFGAYGKAVVRFAMEVRIAKLAIGLRLYAKRNGKWPQTLDQLNQGDSDIDLGPIMPSGPKPFGFRVIDGAAEVWGFPPENAGQITPAEPVDPESRDMVTGQQDLWKYWHWKLPAEE